jgi:integrase
VSLLRRLAAASGVALSAYGFRHTMARKLAAAGVPRDQLARFLGHGKTAISDR